MKIAVLGTGMVGNTIGSKLISLGHDVKMGSRSTMNDKAKEWVNKNKGNSSQGTFAEAAAFGEIIFNCTKGEATMEVLKSAGAENLEGKILIDVSNPLDTSKGMPPTLSICNIDSLGEQIQRNFPKTYVVKTLNTMNCHIMVNASLIKDEHDVFISGNDKEAKDKVKDLLKTFGWESPIDLGDITTARGTEMVLPLWIRLWGALGHADFNFRIVKK